MLFPVRCYSCNKVIGGLWQKYKKYLEEHDGNPEGVWEHIGVTRYCCKSKFLGHVELYDKVSQYKINFPSIKEKL